MRTTDMLKSNAATLLLLIFLNLALFTVNDTAWCVLGCIFLALGLFLSFRQGMGYGHQACSVLETVKRARDPESPTHGQLDKGVIDSAWSVSHGVKTMFASALPGYVIGCLYVACSLLNVQPLSGVLRLISWVLCCPFWPPLLPWYHTYDRLTPVVAAVVMIAPFVLPLCTFAGYMQGPKLWAKSEKAMAEGKRRAKAKSRINRKKNPPRTVRPEI